MSTLDTNRNVWSGLEYLKKLNDFRMLPIDVEKILDFYAGEEVGGQGVRCKAISINRNFTYIEDITVLDINLGNQAINLPDTNADLVLIREIWGNIEQEKMDGFLTKVCGSGAKYLLALVPYHPLKGFEHLSCDKCGQQFEVSEWSKHPILTALFEGYNPLKSMLVSTGKTRVLPGVKRFFSQTCFKSRYFRCAKCESKITKKRKIRSYANFGEIIDVFCSLKYDFPNYVAVLMARDERGGEGV